MKHSIDIRVYYEDTDAGGIVYHSNYLNFAERGRTEFLRDIGFESSDLQRDKNMMFVARHLELDYLKTAYLDDILQMETTILELKNTSFILHQCTFRDGVLIADMRIVLVCIDMETRKPVRLPEKIKGAFQGYQENV